MKVELAENERLDDLGIKNLKIIQNQLKTFKEIE